MTTHKPPDKPGVYRYQDVLGWQTAVIPAHAPDIVVLVDALGGVSRERIAEMIGVWEYD